MATHISTFSIVAADPQQQEVGVAVQSKFLASGALVPWVQCGVGAVATQALAKVPLGPQALALLVAGNAPATILETLLMNDERRDRRQIGIVNAAGESASFTGTGCMDHAGSVTGRNFACQGNLLASARVLPAMAEAFQVKRGALAARMLEALRAGQAAGGDRRGMESAAIVVAKPNGGYGGDHDRYIDLRVDHHLDPIEELGTLLHLHEVYFHRPSEGDVVSVDANLEEELRALLQRRGRLAATQDLWQALFNYMGWENLEERWVGPGRIDIEVLKHLRSSQD